MFYNCMLMFYNCMLYINVLIPDVGTRKKPLKFTIVVSNNYLISAPSIIKFLCVHSTATDRE